MKTLVVLLSLLGGCGRASHVVSAHLPDGGWTGDGATPAEAPPTFVSSSPADGSVGVTFADPIVVQFSTPMDPASTLAAIELSPGLSCTRSVDGAIYRCEHPALAPLAKYTVTVHAGAKSEAGLALADDATFSFTTGPARIDAWHVNGALLREVRQSAGVTALSITGDGLSTVTSATLGSVTAALGAVSETSVALAVTIPSGTPPGDLDLVLTTPAGPLTVKGAVKLCPISAAAGVGSDDAAGTSSSPYATLTKAISVAGAGDTVALADGTYSAGEVWPSNATPTPNVPDGLHLVGASQAGTILAAPAGSSAAGLVLDGNPTVTQLTVQGFQRGVVVLGGTPGLGHVTITQSVGTGIEVEGGTLILSDASVDHGAASGIVGSGSAYVALTSVQVTNNAVSGVALSGTAQLDATGLVADDNGTTYDASNSGVYLTDAATATFTGAASNNAAGGFVSKSSGAILLDQITASGNGWAANCQTWRWCSGIALLGGSKSSRLSGVTASQNRYCGVLVDGPPQIVTIEHATLTHNFDDLFVNSTGIYEAFVNVSDSTIKDGSFGVVYGDFVTLTVTGSTIIGHLDEDLVGLSDGSSGNQFINCAFGIDSDYAIYPRLLGQVTLSASLGSGGHMPRWQIADPTKPGAPFVLIHQ